MSSTGIIHTEAIVLRAIDYSETSRIVTLYTKEMGKTGVMAKGARSARSRFGSTLDPMSRIAAVLHVRAGRDLNILSEASHVRHHSTLRSELARVESGLRMVELVNALLPEREANTPVYGLLAASLTALDHASARTGNVWPFFQLRLATLLGFGPSFRRDEVQDMQGEFGFLDLRTGRVGTTVEEGWVPLRAYRRTLRAFAILARAELSDVLRLELSEPEAEDVQGLVRSYLQHHVEESYPTRSARVFAQFRHQG